MILNSSSTQKLEEDEQQQHQVMVLWLLDHDKQSISYTTYQNNYNNSNKILNTYTPCTTTTKTTIHTNLNMMMPPPSHLIIMATLNQSNSCISNLHNFTMPITIIAALNQWRSHLDGYGHCWRYTFDAYDPCNQWHLWCVYESCY